jgi:hypothetical protein
MRVCLLLTITFNVFKNISKREKMHVALYNCLSSPRLLDCLRCSYITSSIDPPPPPPPHVSQYFNALDNIFTSRTIECVHDMYRETFYIVLFLTFIFTIFSLDRGFTYGRRETNASGFGGGAH